MVIALTPVDIFQRNLFYYKINTNCSSDYEFLDLVGLLWEFFFLSPLGMLEFHVLGPFWGLFGLCFGLCVHGVMALGGLGGQGFETVFHRYDKIGTGGVILSLFQPVVYGPSRSYACIRKTPRINIGWL